MKKWILMFAVVVSAFGIVLPAHASSTDDSVLSELIELVKGRSSEEIEDVVEFIKDKLEEGELETDQDIQDAIKEGEDKFQVALTEEEKQKILDVMHKIKDLGLDPEKLLDRAKDMYIKFGDELVDSAETAVKETVKNSVTNYFSDFGKRIKEFVFTIFS